MRKKSNSANTYLNKHTHTQVWCCQWPSQSSQCVLFYSVHSPPPKKNCLTLYVWSYPAEFKYSSLSEDRFLSFYDPSVSMHIHMPRKKSTSTYLFITIGGMPRLFCAITLFMPLRATILAFIIGSVIASKSKEEMYFDITYFIAQVHGSRYTKC